MMNDREHTRDSIEGREVTRKPEPVAQPKTQITDNRYERFQQQLIPLIATVLGAKATGHPDLDRHLQTLSDLIHNGVD